MRKALVAAGMAAVLALTVGCGGGGGGNTAGGGSGTAASGGTLTLAPIVDAQPWDLKDAGLGNNTLYYQAPYDQLMRLNPKAELEPNLATEWAYEDEAQTVATLTLRDDVTFTDGEKFDATAVKTNLEHTATGSNEAAGQLKGISSVEVVSPTQVRITLTAPDPSFLSNLGSTAGMMASPKAIAEGTLKDTPVGSGPYVMDKGATTPGSVYTFTRNESYWNAEAFPFDTVVFKPLTDPTAMLNALRSGQVDGGLLTTPKNVAPAKQGGLNILEYAPGDVSGVYIWDRGGTKCAPLGDLRVRQAINHAFDREAIIQTAGGGFGEPTLQVFNPSSTAYDEALNAKYPYDVEKAKALMAEAGYAEGFSVDVPNLGTFFPEAQAAMVEQLGAIGITANQITVPPGQAITQLLAGQYCMSFFALASFRSWDTTVIQLQPTSLWNIFKYEDPKVTELIATAQTTTGAEQDAAFKELNTYVVDQAWNSPWLVVKNNYAYSKRVTVEAQEYTPVPYLYNFKPSGQ